MIELDGSSGGGQLLRTALTLSARSGRPFSMHGIREARPNPGLRPQHLAAVNAIAAITAATVSGATEGSQTLRFRPGPIESGRYEVDVGTAGSVTLLFDTVLPLACAIDGTLSLRATGGTDVRWAPTIDYYRRVKLPLLRRLGLLVAVDVERRGFYPAGGGVVTLTLAPSTLQPIEIASTGSSSTARVYSVATTDLAEEKVAERQLQVAVDRLDASAVDVDVVQRTVEYADSRSPGSAVAIRLDRGASILGGDSLGERGKPAESVAREAVEAVVGSVRSGSATDVHLADQLLVFLAITGGQVSIPSITSHVETSLTLLERFGYELHVDQDGHVPVVVG